MTLPPDFPEFLREALDGASEQELLVAAEALALLGVAIAPEPPSAGARQRLLDAAREGVERWSPFVDRLAAFFDLGVARIREIVAKIDDAASWEAGPMPGIELVHFAAGPRYATADNGLVRMAPGLPFPRHKHLGTERILILEGSYTDDAGNEWRAGDVHESDSSIEHGFVVGPEGVTYALCLDGDIWIEGMPGPLRG